MSMPHFPVVIIGASAGGLKAIETILYNLPEKTGMAFIIIQHLSRKYKSLMKEILEKVTPMPVNVAVDGMPLKPNEIFLNPPGHELSVENYQIHLGEQSRDQIPSFVIDTSFHSIGRNLKEKAIGLILSGTGSDGSRGIRTIKEYGGIVIVQEPQSGEFDGMPLSAMDTRLPDFVLPPKEIAARLELLAKLHDNGKLEEEQEGEASPEPDNGNSLNGILFLIQQQLGLDFSGYKESTILRRIHKVMAVHQIQTLSAFHSFLQEHPDQVEALFQEMLIGVTEFFRDAEAFEELERYTFPELVNSYRNGSELRIWVCACSSGEEAYSLAIALNEFSEKQGVPIKFKILATDIDEQALQIASKASYHEERLLNMSAFMKEKYFEQNGKTYEVRKFIRDQIIFARNDATSDPPFINLDMVVCRNLLIYLKADLQKRLLLHFHFGLNPGGFLWLGASENIQTLEHNFEVVSEKWRMYRTMGETPNFRKYYSSRRAPRDEAPEKIYLQPKKSRNQFARKSANYWPEFLLKNYVAPGIIFDEQFIIHFISGDGGKYLHVPSLELNHYLLDMVSQDLVLIIRDASIKLGKEAEVDTLLYKHVLVEERDNTHKDIQIQFLPPVRSRPGVFYYMEFQDAEDPSEENKVTEVQFQVGQTESLEIIQDLQTDLRYAQYEVQQIREELETSSEELQASNEELIASNEELQSTNEELQSVNEELYTVNSELQSRNRELSKANATIDNLLNSTEIGTLFLDPELMVRFFTPPMIQIIPLKESDLGRPIRQLTFPFNYEELEQDAHIVMRDEVLLDKEVQGNNGRWYLIRLTPYRNETFLIDGVVLTFVDITERKQAEMLSVRATLQLSAIIDAIPEYLFMTDLEGNIVYANKLFEQVNLQVILGKHYSSIVAVDTLKEVDSKIKELLETGKTAQAELKVTFLNKEQKLLGATLSLIKNEEGNPHQVLIIARDIQQERAQQDELKQQILTFRNFMEETPYPAWIKNEQFQYQYANPAFLQLVKLDGDSIIGRNDFGLFPEIEARIMRKNDQQVLEQNKALQTTESYGLPNKSYHHTLVVKFPLSVGEQETYIAGFTVDITPMKEAEEGVKQLNSQLEERVKERTEALLNANEDLRTFTRSIAHDLRNPIRAITSYSQIILDQHINGAQAEPKKFLENILHQSKHMSRLVESLLLLAKLGTKAVRKQRFSIHLLAKEIYDDLEIARNGKVYEAVFHEVPEIYADLELMRQVLANLLENAIKYSAGKENPKIEFGSFQEKGSLHMSYYVKDNGVGFEPKYAEKIFGVFERLHPPGSFEGSGIGLSIVKRAIELQNGSVWAESALGRGTTIFFSLPPESQKE